MKNLFLSAAAVAFFALPAAAADLPARMPLKAHPPVAAALWTGCYIGANVGYGWSREDWFDPLVGVSEGAHTGTGVMGGGQAGCDLQNGNFIFGIQGMIDWADVEGSHPYTDDPRYTDHGRVTWLATVTGRVGYAVHPDTLLYVKGGAAFVRNRLTETCDPAVDVCPAVATVRRAGWTIGAGAERRFHQNWSVFAEYNYADFGSAGATIVYTDGSTYDYRIRQELHSVHFGVNYRFGGPLVARY